MKSHVRQALPTHLGRIAEVHEKAFAGFFMTRMGRPFLRAYYGSVLKYPEGILLVSTHDGRVAGFVSGFLDPPRFYALLRRNRPNLALRMVFPLLKHPSMIRRLLTNRELVHHATADRSPQKQSEVELSSIAVDPDYRKLGIGAELVNAFKREARRKGGRMISLITDSMENEAANRFYISLGFQLVNSMERQPRRIMNEYRGPV